MKTVLLLVAATVLLVGSPAGALPINPSTGGVLGGGGQQACRTDPTPTMPGAGVPGFFDHTPHNTAGTSVYDQYGYAGLTWNTFDIGCVPDAGAVFDTMMGDALLGVAVTGVAAANALHSAVASLGFLGVLDPLLRQGTTAVRKAVYTPWIGLSLLILGGLLIWRARHGNLPAALTAAGWALTVMLLATIAVGYPVRAAGLADSLTGDSVGLVNTTVAGHPSRDPAAARGSLIVDDVLWRNWLRGEFGDPDSATARKYGRRLLDAQALTWGQAARVDRDPGAAKSIISGKQHAWRTWTDQIKQSDPAAYWHVTGHGRGRFGAGGLALLAAILVLAFLIVADLIVVAALVVFRLGIILIPVIAPFAVHSRATLQRTLRVMVGGLVNAVLYALGADLQLINIRVVLGGHGLPEWLALALCGLISFVLWRMLRLLWHFGRTLTPGYNPAADAIYTAKAGRRRVGRWLNTATSSYAGTRAGAEAAADEPEVPRPETWSRPAKPERVPDPAPAPGSRAAAGTLTPAPEGGPLDVPAQVTATPPRGPAPGPSPNPPGHRRVISGGADILPAGQELPKRTIRSDPLIVDGQPVYRIYDPDGSPERVKPDG